MNNQSPIIQVKNISKTYDLGEVKVEALKSVSLDVNKGDFLIITGRNGSGKSTLLRQVGLLDHPNSGGIYLENREVTKMSKKERRDLRLNHIGYIFQEYALIPELTAIENVMLPMMMLKKRKECRVEAKDLLTKVGLEKRIRHLPRQLSGGEQQKVAIARALTNNPVVIFADEPTANLDSIASRDILNIFKRLNEDEQDTIVMISHEAEDLEYANRTVKLADGRII